MGQILNGHWSPYLVGMGIGILGLLTFLISRKPIGCSTAYARSSGMLARFFFGPRIEGQPYYREFLPVVDWEWMFVLGIVIGAYLSALVSNDFQWQIVPYAWSQTFGAAAGLRLIVALAGGAILGFGARWANGCTSGHGISGTMQLAVSSWISVIFFFIAGILSAHFLYYVLGR